MQGSFYTKKIYNMIKLLFSGKYFNIKDTLECGQVFRFLPYKNGYLIKCVDKCAYVYNDGDTAVIECEDRDKAFFYNYFDLENDYEKIVQDAINSGEEIIRKSAEIGKGIRLLNQDLFEVSLSFIISQNNNIPRIKSIIEKLCFSLGEKRTFLGQEYYSFPTAKVMAEKDETFYKSLGLGYRAEYVRAFAELVANGFDLKSLYSMQTEMLKSILISLKGIGPKVADCISLFGYKKTDSFPVDTWIEKVYREDLSGKLTDRKKIASELVERFKDRAGYYQQYLFYYKRSIEDKN